MNLSKFFGEATACGKKLMLERKGPLSWLKNVSALANASGGLLSYGVDSDGNLVGLEIATRVASSTLAKRRNAKVILRAMMANGRMAILDIFRETRLSTSGVHKPIATLGAASKFRRVGLTKGGCWEVNK